jgi:thiol-disulfide isomerase/thioredoxin
MIRLIFILILFFSLNAEAQNIRLITSNELEKRLNDGKDSTFVINFWATWCVPCVKELPGFEKLQREFAGEKLKVLLVSVDNKSKANSAVVAFIKKHKLSNEVFVADEQKPVNYIYKIDKLWKGTLPATLMVNKSKNVRQFYEHQFTYNELVKAYQLIAE